MMVNSVMSHPAKTIYPDQTMLEAALAMRQGRVGSLVVVEGKKWVGIVTEGDVVQLVADLRDASLTLVSERMTSPVVTIDAGVDIAAAAQLMAERRVKRLVVVVEDELRGVLTVRDLAYRLPEEARKALEAIKASWQD